MSRTFLASDHHFGHANIYRFTNAEGGRIRPWADNAQDGDAMMIEAWNAVVKPQDRVYHLGDVAIPRRSVALAGALNGRKILIRGNHDIFKLKDYAEHFDDIRGSHKLDTAILSHYPLHPGSLPRWCSGNIHGHTHAQSVVGPDGLPDPRYVNVCVEKIGLAPINFDAIIAMLRLNLDRD